jgi:hypothetical protein
LPLAIAGGQPGSEIQTPLAIVVVSGLVTSTLLNMAVVPALFLRFASPLPPQGRGEDEVETVQGPHYQTVPNHEKAA